MKRRRSQSRGGKSGGSILRKSMLLLIIALSVIGFAVQTGGFSTLDASRNSDIGVASDQNALVGLDITDQLSMGGGNGGDTSVNCQFGQNALVVGKQRSTDVNTNRDVIVTGNRVDISITTTGCVRIESGAQLNGPLNADGSVIVQNGGRVTSDVDAGGDVTVQSGARIDGEVTAGGDVVVESGGRIHSADDVEACGDVTVQSGARIDGDVTAEGTVTVGSGGRIFGDVEEGAELSEECGGGQQKLLSVTNNMNSDVSVTIQLQNPTEGTLFAGSSSGNSVQFTLARGATQNVAIELSDSVGGEIEFELTAESVDTGSSVTLQRTVSTTDGESSHEDGEED